MCMLTKSVGYAMLAIVRQCLRREREEGRKVDVSVLRVRRARLTIVTATMNIIFSGFYCMVWSFVCDFRTRRPTRTLHLFFHACVVGPGYMYCTLYKDGWHRETKWTPFLTLRTRPQRRHGQRMANATTPFVENCR